MLCDHLEGWDREGGREGDARGKRYGNICMCITDSLCYKAETNTPSILMQPQFLTLRLRASPPYKDRLENPVLVSGAQGLGLISPSKTQQGTQFGFRTGQFLLCHYLVGGLNANDQPARFLRLL